MKKQYIPILVITLITILGSIPAQATQNLHFFFTIIMTPLFIYIGAVAQKGMKEKTAARPLNSIDLNIYTTILFATNLILCVIFGAWFKVICWSLLTIVWTSSTIEKYKYILYFAKKDVEEVCESKATS
jgi:predicted membrane protein